VERPDRADEVDVARAGSERSERVDVERGREVELAELALRAIDEALRGLLGESATEALYRHFEEAGLRREELLERPEALEALDRFLRGFFDVGYEVLERALLSALRKRLGLSISTLSELASLLSSP